MPSPRNLSSPGVHQDSTSHRRLCPSFTQPPSTSSNRKPAVSGTATVSAAKSISVFFSQTPRQAPRLILHLQAASSGSEPRSRADNPGTNSSEVHQPSAASPCPEGSEPGPAGQGATGMEPTSCPLPKIRASRRGSAVTPTPAHSCATAPGPLQAGTEDPRGSQLRPNRAPACKEPLLPQRASGTEGTESSPSPSSLSFLLTLLC